MIFLYRAQMFPLHCSSRNRTGREDGHRVAHITNQPGLWTRILCTWYVNLKAESYNHKIAILITNDLYILYRKKKKNYINVQLYVSDDNEERSMLDPTCREDPKLLELKRVTSLKTKRSSSINSYF